MDRHRVDSGLKKIMGLRSSWYIGRMQLERIFLFSSEHPPWMAFFQGSGEPQSVAGRVFWEAMPLVGARLLDCQDPDALKVMIDELLADPEVARAYGLIADTIHAMPPGPEPTDLQLRPEVERFLGKSAARLIGSSLEQFAQLAEAYAAYMNLLSPEQQEIAIGALNMGRPLDSFVIDDSIPIPVRQLMLKWMVGSICTMATAAAIGEHRRIPDWLGLDLVQRVVEGGRCLLQFIQSIPGIGLTSTPPIDLQRLDRDHQEAQLALRLSLLRHRSSGNAISVVGETPDGQ
jgi:hypothetical protein